MPFGARDGLIVGLSGDLDASTTALLRETLDPLLAVPEPVHLIVDASLLRWCDSSGLAELIKAYQRVSRGGGRVALAAVGGMVARLFHRTAMDSIMEIYDSVAEAEAALTCRP
ncbi:anti-sigma factor antagonist [[Actinomadura] parvosata]|uniref:anti-sigma factor antagonist n=1 Tax=[Actinomadura] parvosata TaxID=1955412 RepID=UPI00406C9F8D